MRDTAASPLHCFIWSIFAGLATSLHFSALAWWENWNPVIEMTPRRLRHLKSVIWGDGNWRQDANCQTCSKRVCWCSEWMEWAARSWQNIWIHIVAEHRIDQVEVTTTFTISASISKVNWRGQWVSESCSGLFRDSSRQALLCTLLLPPMVDGSDPSNGSRFAASAGIWPASRWLCTTKKNCFCDLAHLFPFATSL